jgi:hypothetical protein
LSWTDTSNVKAGFEIERSLGRNRLDATHSRCREHDRVLEHRAEGVLAVNFAPTTTSRWGEGTQTVTVTDGRLTISSATGSNNNKICFVEITDPGAAGRALNNNVGVYSFKPLAARKLAIVMNRIRNQSCSIQAELPLDAHTKLADLRVGVDIGGATVEFILDATGRGRTANDRCTLKQSPGTNTATFTASLKGSFAKAWSDCGLQRLHPAAVQMPFSITIGDETYGGAADLQFTGR